MISDEESLRYRKMRKEIDELLDRVEALKQDFKKEFGSDYLPRL